MQSLDIKWDEGALKLERAMLKKEQVECPVHHRFGPGIYIRELQVPAGTLAVGHHQNFQHMNIMLKGKVVMFHSDGRKETFTAPFIGVMPPGRKIGYVVEDMVWQNVYGTDETDVEKLEEFYLTKSPVTQDDMVALARYERMVDREDFLAAIAELDVSEQVVREQSECQDDLWVGAITAAVQVGPSTIEGKGLFATAPFKNGEVIAPARIAGQRTIAGRYTNHAKEPNAIAVLYATGDVAFVAIQDIAGNQGGRLGDEITVDYRQVYATNEESLKCQV